MFRILLLKLRNSTTQLVRKHTNQLRRRHFTGREYLSCDVKIHSIVSSSSS